METSDLTELPEDLLGRLSRDDGLDSVMGSEIFERPEQVNMDTDSCLDDDGNEPDDVIILHMDVREPLTCLQKLVEKKLGVELKGYSFWLQDSQLLEPRKNLVDQCVKGEGLIQINVQVRTIEQRINIVDVLKPTEEALAAVALEEEYKQFEETSDFDTTTADESATVKLEKIKNEQIVDEKPCQNWVLDHKFKREQVRLQIPEDPIDWTVSHVEHWFQWAVQQFDIAEYNHSDWCIDGKTLCSMTHQQFREKIPIDPGNIFWTHLQLLKECKFVAIMHQLLDNDTSNDAQNFKQELSDEAREPKIMRKSSINAKGIPGEHQCSRNFVQTGSSSFGSGSGNNGQMQLWQFLLEILTDPTHVNIIQWVGIDGEFKLTNPEEVARLWGIKKNKPAMNYEKLSRALRYYYDGDMISKVCGKRFAYKFDCNLKLLIGYDAGELSRLVNEKPLKDTLYMNHINDDMLDFFMNEDND